MSRRRLLVSLGVAACVGLAGLLAWLNSRTPRIDAQSFEQICPGMTLAEVEAVLCAPPGDYGGERVYIVHDEVRDGVRRGGLIGSSDRYKEWLGEEIAVLVWLDDEGKVAHKEWVPTKYLIGSRGSFFNALRRWFRW
jgi:hypothetical protein